MPSSRIATAVAGLLVSLLVSAVRWWRFNTFVFFLLIPFVPFLFRGSSRDASEETVRACPTCGFRTQNRGYDYCPRDGTRVEERR
jgi:hypothetical protein